MSRSIKAEMDAEYRQKRLADGGKALLWWSDMFVEGDMNGVRLVSLQVKYTPDGDHDFMVIAKGLGEDGRAVVAFGSGATAGEALEEMAKRGAEKGIRWRDDKPWNPQGQRTA